MSYLINPRTSAAKCLFLIFSIILISSMRIATGITCLSCQWNEMTSTNNDCLTGGNVSTADCPTRCRTTVKLPTATDGATIVERDCSTASQDGPPDHCIQLKSTQDAIAKRLTYDCHCSGNDSCNAESPFKQSKCYTCTYSDNSNGSANDNCLKGAASLTQGDMCPMNIRSGAGLCVKVSGILVGDGYVRVVQRECSLHMESLGCNNKGEFQATDSRNPALPLQNVLACYCDQDLCNGSPDWQPPRPKTGSAGIFHSSYSFLICAFLLSIKEWLRN